MINLIVSILVILAVLGISYVMVLYGRPRGTWRNKF